jgi:hypothetical protein
MSEVNNDEGTSPAEPPQPPQRWSTKRTLFGAGIAFVSILALIVGIIGAVNRDDGASSQHVDAMVASMAADGIDLTEEEARCALDVLDENGYDIEDLSSNISEDSALQLGLDIFEDCPTVGEKIMDSNEDESDEPSVDDDSFSDSEIENATDSELQDMWWDTPSGSDAEAAIEAELDERGLSAGMPAE